MKPCFVGGNDLVERVLLDDDLAIFFCDLLTMYLITFYTSYLYIYICI